MTKIEEILAVVLIFTAAFTVMVVDTSPLEKVLSVWGMQ